MAVALDWKCPPNSSPQALSDLYVNLSSFSVHVNPLMNCNGKIDELDCQDLKLVVIDINLPGNHKIVSQSHSGKFEIAQDQTVLLCKNETSDQKNHPLQIYCYRKINSRSLLPVMYEGDYVFNLPDEWIQIAEFEVHKHTLMGVGGEFASTIEKRIEHNFQTHVRISVRGDASNAPETIQAMKEREIGMECYTKTWYQNGSDFKKMIQSLNSGGEDYDSMLPGFDNGLPNSEFTASLASNTTEQTEEILRMIAGADPYQDLIGTILPVVKSMNRARMEILGHVNGDITDSELHQFMSEIRDKSSEEVQLLINAVGKYGGTLNKYRFDPNFRPGVQAWYKGHRISNIPNAVKAAREGAPIKFEQALVGSRNGESHDKFGASIITDWANNNYLQKLQSNLSLLHQDRKHYSEKQKWGLGLFKAGDCEDTANDRYKSTKRIEIFSCDETKQKELCEVLISTRLLLEWNKQEITLLRAYLTAVRPGWKKVSYRVCTGAAAGAKLSVNSESEHDNFTELKLPYTVQDSTKNVINGFKKGLVGGHCYMRVSRSPDEIEIKETLNGVKMKVCGHEKSTDVEGTASCLSTRVIDNAMNTKLLKEGQVPIKQGVVNIDKQGNVVNETITKNISVNYSQYRSIVGMQCVQHLQKKLGINNVSAMPFNYDYQRSSGITDPIRTFVVADMTDLGVVYGCLPKDWKRFKSSGHSLKDLQILKSKSSRLPQQTTLNSGQWKKWSLTRDLDKHEMDIIHGPMKMLYLASKIKSSVQLQRLKPFCKENQMIKSRQAAQERGDKIGLVFEGNVTTGSLEEEIAMRDKIAENMNPGHKGEDLWECNGFGGWMLYVHDNANPFK